MSQVDTIAARELLVYIENDGNLYRQQHEPIIKNLVLKIDRGAYDHEKAVKLYGYLVESGAKKYTKDFAGTGDKWNEIFSKPTREAVAREFVARFEGEYKLGNYDNLHAKKYSGKSGALKNPAKATFSILKSNPMPTASDYRIVNGTSYHLGTSDAVVRALEHARATGMRIRIFLGDVNTGRSWNEENDVVGKLGRSTGTIKVPLLLTSSRSTGGGAISDNAIVAILSKNGWLYKHPKFSTGEWNIGKAPADATNHGYSVGAYNDGQNVANFKNMNQAYGYVNFMMGRAMSKTSTVKSNPYPTSQQAAAAIYGKRLRRPVKKSSYAFDVILNGKNIDTVFHSQMSGTKAEMEDDVKRSLVGHDGYDPSIKVRRVPMKKNPVGATRKDGAIQVTKKEFYAAGGFANSSYFRVMRSGSWKYFKKGQ